MSSWFGLKRKARKMIGRGVKKEREKKEERTTKAVGGFKYSNWV